MKLFKRKRLPKANLKEFLAVCEKRTYGWLPSQIRAAWKLVFHDHRRKVTALDILNALEEPGVIKRLRDYGFKWTGDLEFKCAACRLLPVDFLGCKSGRFVYKNSTILGLKAALIDYQREWE